MSAGDRWALIGALLILEIVLFFLPVGTMFAVFVLLSRPVWFRDWVLRLYAEE